MDTHNVTTADRVLWYVRGHVSYEHSALQCMYRLLPHTRSTREKVLGWQKNQSPRTGGFIGSEVHRMRKSVVSECRLLVFLSVSLSVCIYLSFSLYVYYFYVCMYVCVYLSLCMYGMSMYVCMCLYVCYVFVSLYVCMCLYVMSM
jgi:hypothetical protein